MWTGTKEDPGGLRRLSATRFFPRPPDSLTPPHTTQKNNTLTHLIYLCSHIRLFCTLLNLTIPASNKTPVHPTCAVQQIQALSATLSTHIRTIGFKPWAILWKPSHSQDDLGSSHDEWKWSVTLNASFTSGSDKRPTKCQSHNLMRQEIQNRVRNKNSPHPALSFRCLPLLHLCVWFLGYLSL